MAAAEHLSDHIKKFMPYAQAEGWDTCEGAGGACEAASEDFRSQVGRGRHIQFAGEKFDRSNVAEGWRNQPEGWLSHHAPVIDDHVVDWTYRQFDPSADFPLVEHIDDYSKRWDRQYDVSHYWDDHHKGPINR